MPGICHVTKTFRPVRSIASGEPMRPLLSPPIALMIVTLLTASASAQQGPGWVDPPAKPTEPDTNAPLDSKTETSSPTLPAAHAKEAVKTEPNADGRSGRNKQLARSPADSAPRIQAPDARHMTNSESDPRTVELADASRQLTEDYLDSVSAPNAQMLASAPRFYGERVQFHGRRLSTAALIEEKRRFVRRWPQRRYTLQKGGIHTACNAAAATCLVRTTLGFRAESPARNARSQGVSELILTVSFAGGRPVIVSESSRVLRRSSAALEALPHRLGMTTLETPSAEMDIASVQDGPAGNGTDVVMRLEAIGHGFSRFNG